MNLRIIADADIPFLKGRLENAADVKFIKGAAITSGLIRDIDALLIRTRTRCDASLLAGTDVRLIATATIGTDHIDLGWCGRNGIEVRNAPGCNAPGVAQYVWSALLRMGMKPGVNTIGLAGHGNVGSIVAEWGEAMGFEILLSDPPKADRLKKEGRVEEARRYVTLDELLSRSDAVTLHTPLTYGGEWPTYHLIDSHAVSLMKPGSILVNASRGGVAGNEALHTAADKGVRLVIDTWEGEPAIDRQLLEKAEIGTCHIAGYSLEGKQRATRMALESLEEEFGLKFDKSGLANVPTRDKPITAEAILKSYDPFRDDLKLRENPGAFEMLRARYDYRAEPVFPQPAEPDK